MATALTIPLTPDLERLVRSGLDSGRYRSASEMIQQGLRLLLQARGRDEVLLDLRARIQTGVEQAEAGELHDGESVFAEFERELLS